MNNKNIYNNLEKNNNIEIKKADQIRQEIKEELMWHYKDLFINI